MEGIGSLSRPTATAEPDLARSRRARAARRVVLSLLVVFIVLGLTGWLGVRSRTTTATGGGYRLTVRYAQVTRGGLATPWSFVLHRPGGFDGPVEVAAGARYFDLFDENAFEPEPDSVTTTGDEVIWTFEPPPGDRLTVTLDARLEPAVQWGRGGHLSVLEDSEPVVTARYKTWVLP